MTHVIIRGKNGRRHEVDFENTEITVEVYANDTAVELVIEAQDEDLPPDKRRFALVNLPKSAFDKAMADLARSRSTALKAID